MRKIVVVIPFVIATFIGMVFLLSRSTAGLKAELLVSDTDIGIPGISKMYEARLVNHGLWPVRVSRCDFVSDTLTPGKMAAYAVEKWDTSAKRWTTVVASTTGFCKLYPLGIVKAELTTGFLWPSQALSAAGEATAAREEFNLGDRGRFVVFVGAAGDYSRAVSTREFIIDEHPTTDTPVRLRH